MNVTNPKFGISQSAKRVEDNRFLTGHGRYIDDVAPEGALFAAFLRSPIAHAEITELDISDAEAADGVHLVLTAQKLLDQGVQLGMNFTTVKNRDGTDGAGPERPVLANGRVRFVGEPVAMVVADTLEQARDAVEMIGFDFDDLPVHLERETGGPEIHPEAPGNLAYDWAFGDEDKVAKAFDGAAHVVALDVEDNRVIVNSMEPRGCFAEMEDGRLHFAVNGQGVWGTKAHLAKLLGMDEDDVHVTTPDVGGGFGMKGMDYPEYFPVAQAARMLDKPVRWMSDRTEAMLSDNGGRDLTSKIELAFDEGLKLIGYRNHTMANMGAYNSLFAQPIQTGLYLRILTGVYDVQDAFFSSRGVFTNTNQIDAYRGAGRPEAIYALERTMDHAARVFGIDPFELRRRSFIPSDAFPYSTASGELYDVGDFHGLLAKAETRADVAGFAARKAVSEAQGKLRGLGLCYYIESILGDPSESAALEFNEDGTVSLFVGTQSNGQGHETVYPQILQEFSGIPAENVRVIQGDSDRIKQGGGTGGSRSVTTQGVATRGMVKVMADAFGAFLEDALGVEGVTFEDGTFSAPGTNQRLSMQEAAELARERGRTELLRHDHRETLPGRSFPNGAHIAEVEIDPDTGHMSVDSYTVVDDFGVLMNPMLAKGQVHGGVAQGVGQAIMEHVVHDEEGQLLTATFMDYAIPRAGDLPMIGFDTAPVPSTANPLGMKGCGEAGTVGAMAAIGNAVQDAVWDRGLRQVDMPFTPNRLWSYLNEADTGAQ
ncbi:MAG: xanthine dehydrogenase family protein molybdopterin-binding subunit [Brevirhabdus sp.]